MLSRRVLSPTLGALRGLLSQQQTRLLAVTAFEDYATYKTWRAATEKPAKVLYFTAKWCPPCKMISPVYDQLSETHKTVAFGKIDVDVVIDAATEQRIRSVPTFQFYKDGKKVHEVRRAVLTSREIEHSFTDLATLCDVLASSRVLTKLDCVRSWRRSQSSRITHHLSPA